MRSIVIAVLALASLVGDAAFADSRPSSIKDDPNFTRVQMMCTKSGERVSGMNKICYYDCAGNEATQTISSTGLCPLNMRSRNAGGSVGGYERPNRGAACFKTGERLSGLNKICSYNCGGSGRDITVGSAQLCPLNPR